MAIVAPAILHRLGDDVNACEQVAHAIGRSVASTFVAVIDGPRPTVLLSRAADGFLVDRHPEPQACGLLLVLGKAGRSDLAERLRTLREFLRDDGLVALPSETAVRRWSLSAIAWARLRRSPHAGWPYEVAVDALRRSGLTRTVAVDPTRAGVRIHLGSYQPFRDNRQRDDIGRVVHDTSL